MLTRQKMIVSLGVTLFAASANAGSVYVVTSNQQFGTLDLSTGAFTQTGPGLPGGSAGLVPGPGGSLLTLANSGNLDSINPKTGVTTVVGATGLADCSTPASPCGLKSANTIGELGGKIYATDFQNNLYSVNSATGHATLIGPTGIPAAAFVPFSTNPDGTFNIFDSSLFGDGGKLYGTFDTGTVNPVSGALTPVITDDLYQIDPSTGQSTLIAPTTFGLDAFADINGTVYTFKNNTRQVITLELGNGSTTVVGGIDPNAGLIFGAAPAAPEPTSIALAGAGLVAIALCRRRMRGR